MSIRTPSAVLGPEGSLAQLIDGYESRPQQVAMAELVEQAIAKGEHAIVEAPTGVGKSFAYLVPAVQYALEQRRRVVISTGTMPVSGLAISLADQYSGSSAVGWTEIIRTGAATSSNRSDFT